METMTISQLSKSMGISTRMLRYYEQTGLIVSLRREGYAYRIYDEQTISRLGQILILRKLRIPVRQIKTILKNPGAVEAIEIFRQHISELDKEVTAMSTIKDILGRFVEELSKTAKLPLNTIIAEDDTLLASIESLSLISINFKEDQTMNRQETKKSPDVCQELQKADETLSKASDIRIIYLPPAAVAAAHFIGEEPEANVNALIDKFVLDTALDRIKPDLRHYGFNHPNPFDETGYHGYEAWVTIPDDMDVPAPLIKKQFPGGLYAAHMIPFGNFNEWEILVNWVDKSEAYEFAGDWADQEHMCGLIEEHLNYISHIHLTNTEPEDLQLDLLMPVREK